jgi:hypothetical protein
VFLSDFDRKMTDFEIILCIFVIFRVFLYSNGQKLDDLEVKTVKKLIFHKKVANLI